MSNIAALAIYIPLSIITAAILVLSLLGIRQRAFRHNLAFLSASLLGWQLANVAYYLSNSQGLARTLYDLDLGFVGFTSLAVLLFVLNFYELGHYLSRAYVGFLLVFPVFTTVLAIWSPPGVLRQNLTVLATSPAHLVNTSRGPWFWVHTAYCYLLMVVCIVVVIYMHRRLPKPMRFSSSLLIAGISITLFANLLVLINPLQLQMDFTALGAGITLLLLYISVHNSRGMDHLVRGREQVFDNMEKKLIIFDAQGKLLAANARAGEQLAEDFGAEEEITLEKVLDDLTERAEQAVRPDDENAGIDYYLRPQPGKGLVLNVREKTLVKADRRFAGTLLIGSDVTQNRQLIEQLELVAGMDSLTGLSNRQKMLQQQAEMDCEEFLPLAVIVGDLNNLKKVNDSLGHSAGDLLLRRTAQILQASCPPSARIARMGGDEFLVLLPNTAAMTTQAIVSNIKKALKATPDRAMRPSLAMGYAIKRRSDQNLSDIIQKADSAMYANKRSERR